ncbi:unnamed protein product [Adineta ricciae]|uniref:Uncharacterized protein n=1 Tax=Adineta ricciae TaxID=249248 RepID=A0A813QFB2_ADIRI|nr:unnamed protein product [Adineta ricciae]CAF1204976.1 unnamed protein product [Adineta ricciae]
MRVKTKSTQSRSIGQWCEDFGSNLDRGISSLKKFLYNQRRGEICGRNSKQWSRLSAFYFFFFITLAGFFCLYLSIYMSSLPLNQPRYIGKASRLTTRANPLSPGLSFRPQPEFNPKEMYTVIRFTANGTGHRGKRSTNEDYESYVKNLDEFFNLYYSLSTPTNFTISDVGDCHSEKQYGFKHGQPCFLIKMNKIIGFIPEIGRTNLDREHQPACTNIPNIPVRCQGEKESDQEKLGNIMYYSESGSSDLCGTIDVKHFPYNGKVNRKDAYQVPYVWVQFINLTANVLLTIECRVYGANIFYDKIAQRASIRFQLYLNKNSS